MIVHYCPTVTLQLDAAEADEAHRLLTRVNELGDDACGSPAHNQALDDYGAFIGRIARDNCARGHSDAWEWAPQWQLKPPQTPQEMSFGKMMWIAYTWWIPPLWRWIRGTKPTASPPLTRAEVVPIRRK